MAVKNGYRVCPLCGGSVTVLARRCIHCGEKITAEALAEREKSATEESVMAEEQRQREAEEQRQREAEEQRQREAEEQRQREAEEQLRREAEREAEEMRRRLEEQKRIAEEELRKAEDARVKAEEIRRRAEQEMASRLEASRRQTPPPVPPVIPDYTPEYDPEQREQSFYGSETSYNQPIAITSTQKTSFFSKYFFQTFFGHYADFSGSTSVKYYWLSVLAYVIVTVLVYGAGMTIAALSGCDVYTSLGAGYCAMLLLMAILFIPSLSLGVRRMHDQGKNGTWVLISLVPVIGSIWFLILTLTPGESKHNTGSRFGFGDVMILMFALALPVVGSVQGVDNSFRSSRYESDTEDTYDYIDRGTDDTDGGYEGIPSTDDYW
ncbi:MAG: DUF805 domain-containing protein [Muribaculum sp.]|nr:DUF805 domain-containing protein [Muribaculum sp.]